MNYQTVTMRNPQFVFQHFLSELLASIAYTNIIVLFPVAVTNVLWQSLVSLWIRTDEEVGPMKSSGAACLCRLVKATFILLVSFFSQLHLSLLSLSKFVCPVMQPTENPTCLSPTSTPWMWLKSRDTQQCGEADQSLCNSHLKVFVLEAFKALFMFPAPRCWPTWTFPTRATLAQPSPPEPFTWPPPTRASCGSSAAREAWSESLESCRGPAPAEGQLTTRPHRYKTHRHSI